MHTEPESTQLQIKARTRGLKPIHRAILENDLEALSQELANGIDPNFQVTPSLTILHLAAQSGTAAAVEKILENGADPNARTDGLHAAPLHLAARNGDEDIIRVLIKYADPNCKDPRNGYTPAHVAASFGRAGALKLLSEVADIEAKEDVENAMTPLHIAARGGHTACVRTLAEAGANVDARYEPLKDTALIHAAFKDDATMISTLVSAGADVDAATTIGRTAALAACYTGSTRALRVLIAEGANLDVQDDEGYTALRCAIEFNQPKAAMMLLKNRVQLNKTFTEHHDTVLHYAVSRNQTEVVQKLLDKEADFRICDSDGDPPLQWAVQGGQVALVEMLIKAGADVNERNSSSGLTILSWAIKCGHVGVTKLLLRSGAKSAFNDLETLQPQAGTSEESFLLCKKLAKGEMSSDELERISQITDANSSQELPSTSEAQVEQTPSAHAQNNIRYEVYDIPSQAQIQELILPYQDTIAHNGIFCDGPFCQLKPKMVIGIRYRCFVCENVDFCSKCISSYEISHDARHPMVKCLLPTRFGFAQELDHLAKQQLLDELGERSLAATDVKSALIAQTLEYDAEGHLPAYLFEQQERAIFLRSDLPDSQPDAQREGIVEYGDIEPGNSVAMYTIDENANVRVKYQPVGKKPEAKLQQEGILHHQDPKLLAEVFFTGKIKAFDYRSLPKFYDMVNEGQVATRVIDILPGGYDDKLDIRLRVADVAKDQYDALSYTWRETNFERAHMKNWDKETNDTFRSMQNIKHAVYVQEGDQQSYLTIGTGLRDALKRLRSESDVVTLWADQLCINQQHLEEREFQVARMKFVFAWASKVLVWIGEEDENTREAFEVMKKISSAVGLLGFHPSPELLQDDENIDLPEQSSPVWRAILDHLSRPVFGRCWVIQEIVVARNVTVQCGPFLIDWSDIAEAVKVFAVREWMNFFRLQEMANDQPKGIERSKPKPPLAEVLQMDGIRWDFLHLKELKMEALIYLTVHFEVSDPRDKIYSVMGIQSARTDFEPANIQPNYSSPIEVAYVEATKAIILEAGSFGICALNYSLDSKNIKNLPSWVPDYSVVDDASRSFNRPIPPPPYNACGQSDHIAFWPYEEHPHVLATSSLKANKIVQVSTTVWPDTSDASRGPAVEEWTALASLEATYPSNGEDISHAFTRTLVADNTHMWRETPVPASYHPSIVLYMVTTYVQHMKDKVEAFDANRPMYAIMSEMIGAVINADDETLATMDAEHDAVPAMTLACGNRKFFVAYDGQNCHFGIGSKDMQVGDEVHVLSGCPVPFILRRVERSGLDIDGKTDKEDDGSGGVATCSNVDDAADVDTTADALATVSLRDEDTEKSIGPAIDEAILDRAQEDDTPLYGMVGECYMHGIMKGELFEDGKDADWQGIYIC